MRSGTDIGRKGLARIPTVFDKVEVRALCGPVKFFHTELIEPCLYGPPIIVHWTTVMLK